MDYTVDLPAGLPVSGGTSSGGVDLSGVGGVAVSTRSGAITLQSVGGPVEVQTTNGEIRGRGLRGDRIRAETSNGAIDLVAETPQDVRAVTSNGAITLAVPAARYQVSAQTTNGRTAVAVADDPAGEHRLDLSTANGAITVTQA